MDALKVVMTIFVVLLIAYIGVVAVREIQNPCDARNVNRPPATAGTCGCR